LHLGAFLSLLRNANLFQQSATPTYAHKPPKTVTPTVLMLDFRPQTAQNCGSYSFDARTHKPPKTVAPTVLMLEQFLPSASLFQQSATPTLTTQTAQNCNSYSFDARQKKPPKTVAPTVLMLE